MIQITEEQYLAFKLLQKAADAFIDEIHRDCADGDLAQTLDPLISAAEKLREIQKGDDR